MMNNKIKLISLLLIGAVSQVTMAVQVNPKGLGEVLIYPYYTVNNDLNTLYSVVNTTPDTKALAVRFLEGDNGMEVLSFNIYLSAYDVWTGVLVPVVSSQLGHNGEPSALHITSDTSCAPFLNKANQEFLPFVIDIDLDLENHNLKRAREGHIEIIELATFNGATTAAADHGNTGVPANCAAIQGDWDDGVYNTLADEQAPTAGLLGSATVVNVFEGLAFPYDAIALQNFWQGTGLHSEPGSLVPDLNSAFPQSSVLLENGELAVATWDQGFQAVSAVLTKAFIINEYGFDTIINGKTEWVMSFPTKSFHTDSNFDYLPPFHQTWDGVYACDEFEIDIWDREEVFFEPENNGCGILCPPGPRNYEMCKVSNVIEFNGPNSTTSQILGSDNIKHYAGPSDAVTESGWAKLGFLDAVPVPPISGSGFSGLPVTGFAVQQYTNAGAAQGLLAQYGALFKHKGLVVTDEELVD